MKPCQPKVTLLWIASLASSTSMMATAASIRATTSQNVPLASTRITTNSKEVQLQQGQRELQEGGFWPTFPPMEGGGDGSFLEDKDANGIPDWLDASMPDWGNMDWANFSMGDMDWNGINWTSNAWGEFLNGLLGGGNSGTGTGAPFEFCPILESAIGIGQSFGIAGNCTCDGNLGNGLMIDCDFKECMTSSTTGCTDIGLNFTFDDVTSMVNASICVDAPEDTYEEFCFSYKLDMPATGDAVAPEPTCQASYAGKPCGCTIEGLCVALDCSAYLPGAKMDTCQYLSFVDAGDATSLVPSFPIFNETFNGSFSFGDVNWTNLDWANVDWDNFGFDRINWTDANVTIPWGSLFNTNTNQSAICSILSSRVLSMDTELVNQDCTCTGDLENGFSIQCSFEEECVATTTGDVVAISKADQEVSQESTICAEVALGLEFNDLGYINGSLCADFAEDVHPTTCINYSIPIADQATQPQCQATYGGQPCKCSIDESLCVKVDCSAYEASAVMDTCQVLSVEDEEDVPTVIPRFALPSQAAVATTSPPNSEEGSSSTLRPNQSAQSEANELNANSAAHSRIVSLALVGASILSILTL